MEFSSRRSVLIPAGKNSRATFCVSVLVTLPVLTEMALHVAPTTALHCVAVLVVLLEE